MYRKFYNLTAKPFELNPDPKFLWLGEKHKEGLSAVRYGILANAGFLSLTGDVGTGKTTLVNALVNSLGKHIIVATINNPALKLLDFFNFMADALALNKKFGTKGEFLRHLRPFLEAAHTAGNRVLLIIEEAQRLNQTLMEEVRLLSNIEKQNAKLISILFVGQNEFNDKLKKNRALQQRLNISYNIQPLTENETNAYIGHRLNVAGAKRDIFSRGAIHDVHSFSRGNPRLINVVCDLAMLRGYLKDALIIDSPIIQDCVTDYEISHPTDTGMTATQTASAAPNRETAQITELVPIQHANPPATEKPPGKPDRRRLAFFGLVLPFAILGLLGALYVLQQNNGSVAGHINFLKQSIGGITVSPADTPQPGTPTDKAAATGIQPEKRADNEIRKTIPGSKPVNHESQQAEIARLNNRLADLKAQKAAREVKLNKLQAEYDALTLEMEDLKGTQDRLAALEKDIAAKEQNLADLAKHLSQEKSAKDKVDTELAAKSARVAELQQELQAYRSNELDLKNEIQESKKQIAWQHTRLAELEAQKTSADSQLTRLKTRNAGFVTEIEALKDSQERLAVLEADLKQRDQSMSALEKQLVDLQNDLNQEKGTKYKLNAELAAKTVQLKDLRQKLSTFDAEQVTLESERASSTDQIAQLQSQLSNLNVQKSAAENELSQLKIRNDALLVEIEELKGDQKRLAALENDLKQRDQTLTRLQDKSNTELAAQNARVVELQQELNAARSNELALKNEIQESKKQIAWQHNRLAELARQLSARTVQVADLQQKLNDFQADRGQLDDDLAHSKSEITRLNPQLTNLKAPKASDQIAPVVLKMRDEPQTQDDSTKAEAQSANPGAIIDWVLKKKLD